MALKRFLIKALTPTQRRMIVLLARPTARVIEGSYTRGPTFRIIATDRRDRRTGYIEPHVTILDSTLDRLLALGLVKCTERHKFGWHARYHITKKGRKIAATCRRIMTIAAAKQAGLFHGSKKVSR